MINKFIHRHAAAGDPLFAGEGWQVALAGVCVAECADGVGEAAQKAAFLIQLGQALFDDLPGFKTKSCEFLRLGPVFFHSLVAAFACTIN